MMTEIFQISIFDNRKHFAFSIQESGDIAILTEKSISFESDGLILGTPPRMHLLIRFSYEKMEPQSNDPILRPRAKNSQNCIQLSD